MIELFITFFKLGLFTIGGGVAMIPILSDIAVHEKKWFNEEEAIDMISICQSLPGVIAINMATYVGFKKRGLLGSFVATFGVILPSFLIILLVAKGLAVIGDNPVLLGALGGLRAAAFGLILIAVWQVGSKVVRDGFSLFGALASFAMISWLHISVVYVILLFLILGIARAVITTRRMGGGQ